MLSLRRRICAAVLLPLTLAGALATHNHSHGLGSHGAFARSVSRAASHPNQPCHFEAAGEVESPTCAACLHGLTARCLPPRAAPALRANTASGRLLLAPALVPTDPCASRAGGRSPPFA
jgi:hypothetical protein